MFFYILTHSLAMRMYHLGQVATRIPLLISAPWLSETHGRKTDLFAEAVDIFQTLGELAGIAVPESEGAQGKSLVPVMKAPANPSAAVHTAALSQFPRCWQNQTAVNGGVQRCGDENNNTNSLENMCDCHWSSNAGIAFMGYSMRTAHPFPLRYTEWVRWNVTRPMWDAVVARELYNHTGDTGDAFTTDGFENVNLVDEPSLAKTVATLSLQLREEFAPYILADVNDV